MDDKNVTATSEENNYNLLVEEDRHGSSLSHKEQQQKKFADYL